MTDREMLLLSYGAMKAIVGKVPQHAAPGLGDVVEMVEEHLYPPSVNYEIVPDLGPKLGDWTCSCDVVNGAGQFKCGKCGNFRPSPTIGSGQ